MSVTKVLITDMPGPAFWEFMIQWGGLFIQTVAAIGTVGAILVALNLARRDAAWRQDAEAREREVVEEIIKIELGNLEIALRHFRDGLSGLDQVEDGLPYSASFRACLALYETNLSVESCWKLVDKLGWLGPGRRAAVGRILGRVPMILSGGKMLVDWSAEQISRQEFARTHLTFLDTVISDCEGYFRSAS
ncbi:hypothetical protein [Achromobacter denitrificans]|uniref:hypothetical protein n=1 Tax=Achromobacter denitrificans TaxID=32002 RepID=UPI000B48DB8A|nr:hypothetical protein [Achromobacter denitrificans]